MTETKQENTIWLSPLVPDRQFHVEFRDDHVHVNLGKGFRIDPDQGGAFWNKVRRVCEEHRSSRLLVEGYVPAGERKTVEVVDAGKRTATVPKLWMAFCFENFEPTGQSELYAAIAASNGVRVKFFSDTERALKWLRRNAAQ